MQYEASDATKVNGAQMGFFVNLRCLRCFVLHPFVSVDLRTGAASLIHYRSNLDGSAMRSRISARRAADPGLPKTK
jgi:hypothetical protein